MSEKNMLKEIICFSTTITKASVYSGLILLFEGENKGQKYLWL